LVDKITPAINIIEALKAKLDSDAFQNIKSLSQFGSTKTWLIKFFDDDYHDKYLNTEIRLNEKNIKLIDANDISKVVSNKFTLKAILRIHWLPPCTSIETVENYIKNELKAANPTVISTTEEKNIN
jgi:hypothetical protein